MKQNTNRMDAWEVNHGPTCPWSILLEVDSRDAPRGQEESTEPSKQPPQLTQQQSHQIQCTHHCSNIPAQ